jgi:hypothetical protein
MTVEMVLAGALVMLVIVGALSARPAKKWYRKIRRRRGGIYLWRVDHPRNRARRRNGYVGRTNSFYFRGKQHMEKASWADLNPICHKVIKLPWWLCWVWVMDPLETLVILCTWPIYNDAKNHWNPRRVPRSLAIAQRAQRDRGQLSLVYRTRVSLAHVGRAAAISAGAVLIIVGTYGWMTTL